MREGVFIMSVKNQEVKLNEAKFFYSEMQSKQQVNELEGFKYYLSAFSSAARSILQYACDDAKDRGKQIVYDNLVNGKSAIKYFKDVRDTNIHERPVSTVAHGYADIPVSLVVRGADDAELSELEEEIAVAVSGYTYHFEDEENVLEKSEAYLSELEVFIADFKNAF